MDFKENIKVALRSLRSNFLRALLTLLIISVGIASLVGMLTAIDTMLFYMSDSFSRMGANTYQIEPLGDGIKSRNSGKDVKQGDPISFDQAMDFKEIYDYDGAVISLFTFCKWNETLKYQEEKTNPNIRVVGIDENYFGVTSYELEKGRNFTKKEIESGDHKVVIGSDLVKILFDKKPEKALNQIIRVGNVRYKVIGTLKTKGSSMNDAQDMRVFIPLFNAKRYYGYANRNYDIMAAVQDPTRIDESIASATGSMRNIRKLKAIEENDFEITKSDGLIESLKDMTTELRVGTIAIALMTLFGAAIGLMNIMLVSVTERTREIGIRKALGATRSNIMLQFLIEAIVITIMGGIVGIILGIIIGFGLAIAIDGRFVLPVQWILLGMAICIIVGVVSGLYPALKASRLDPIEALRYE